MKKILIHLKSQILLTCESRGVSLFFHRTFVYYNIAELHDRSVEKQFKFFQFHFYFRIADLGNGDKLGYLWKQGFFQGVDPQ